MLCDERYDTKILHELSDIKTRTLDLERLDEFFDNEGFGDVSHLDKSMEEEEKEEENVF